jgi:hypothetical protein
MVNIPGILRARRKAKVGTVEFLPVSSVFRPQREVVMLKDVTGWVNNDKRTGKKWHFNTGGKYYIDDNMADSFILKGYAEGQLSRSYSEDEIAEMRSAVQTINTPAGGPNG